MISLCVHCILNTVQFIALLHLLTAGCLRPLELICLRQTAVTHVQLLLCTLKLTLCFSKPVF